MHRVGKVVLLVMSTLFAAGAGGCGGSRSGAGAARGSVAAQGARGAAIRPGPACRPPWPSAALAVPAGNQLDLQLSAVGVQIYTCTSTAAGAAWTFTAPEATLHRGDGEMAGRHYAGPTWEALDGSTVVGARVAGATPDPTAIPWLLLRAASHAGLGTMNEVTFIQRVATTGGLAPETGCSAATAGALARVPYTAIYCFHEADN